MSIQSKLKIKLFFYFLVFICSSLEAIELDTSKIKNYTITREFFTQNQNKYMLIRKYEQESKIYFLGINLDTLRTSIIDSTRKLKLKKANQSILLNSNYDALRKKAFENSISLSNAGINDSFSKKKDEVYLTIDMCPSSKQSYEKEFFEEFLDLKELNKKIPISIAITYKWVKDHKEEFLSLITNPHLDITWINHSKNHYYNPKEELSKNFMLNIHNNLPEEIEEVEKMLLLNNQIPSILFRFPGLISNKKIVKELLDTYSLIPLGTNNWLVKSNKAITDGDIILVHGNLNEKAGVTILSEKLKDLKTLKPIYNSLLSHINN